MSGTRRFQMVQVDVFSSQPLEGNSLAVFLDGRGLSDAEMQAVAREMNLSETTFVLPRETAVEEQKGVRVRIFTVAEELPFAGHPTLGTAFALRKIRNSPEIILDLNVGKVPVKFEQSESQPVFGEMTQIEPSFGARHEHSTVARVTGFKLDDLDISLPVQTVSTGVAFTVVPLRSLSAIRKLSLDQQRVAEYLEKSEGKFFYFVTRETETPDARLHARMIFYNGEDPATGSAAGCAAAWMVAHGVAKPEERVLIEQGFQIKRPSRIFVRAGKNGDRVVNVRVGGHAVEVMTGEVFF